MIDNIIIRFIKLPMRIHGLIEYSAIEDTYNIYINKDIGFYAQQKAIEHELQHYYNNDFDNNVDIRQIEN